MMMPSIQELIAKFYQSDKEHSEESAQAVVDAFLQQETFLIARFPETKQFFISMESGQQTAIFFSERDTFEKFAVYCKEKGIHVDAVEFSKEKRDLLFVELWRCGFTRIMIDFLPAVLNISLFDVFTPPDYSRQPLHFRPVIAPRMTGKILYLMQQVRSGKATGTLELDVLTELYHSPFYTSANIIRVNGKNALQINGHENADGTKSLLIFSDVKEFMAVEHPSGEKPSIVWYPDIMSVMKQGMQTLVINSGSGASLTLDLELLNAAEQAATGQTEDFELHDTNNITITELENVSQELLQALSAELQNYKEVNSAYLLMMKTDAKLRPSYLLVLEAPDSMKNHFRDIFQSIREYLQGQDFECTTADEKFSLLQLTGKNKPFYRKKRLSFFS